MMNYVHFRFLITILSRTLFITVFEVTSPLYGFGRVQSTPECHTRFVFGDVINSIASEEVFFSSKIHNRRLIGRGLEMLEKLLATITTAIIIIGGIHHRANADPRQNEPSFEQKIHEDLLQVLADQMIVTLNATPRNDIGQITPLALLTTISMMQIKLYHESILKFFFTKQEKLEKQFALAKFIDKFQRTFDAKLNISNAIVYDQNKVSAAYLHDMKTLYKSETINLNSFDEVSLNSALNNWLSVKTKGRVQKNQQFKHLLAPYVTSIELSFTSFTSCWNTRKTSTTFFKQPPHTGGVQMITAKESLGYYNDPVYKYEAISVPYKNGEFLMTVVLPYRNESLDIFNNFTHLTYHRLFQRVSVKRQNIDYAIPFLNLTTLVMNTNGTSINGDDPIICDWSSTSYTSDTDDTSGYEYIPFYVNRPYALFIYDQSSETVLMTLIVRDPTVAWKRTENIHEIEFESSR